jgi:hypothetical protein
MEKRDEFTDTHAMAMLAEKANLPEGNCRTVLRALNRNGFVVKEIVEDDSPEFPYGTIESLNQKFDRTRTLEIERQGLINQIKGEWNDIQKKYAPILSALTSAMEATRGTSDTFPSDDAGPSGSSNELPEVRQDV